MIIPDVTHPDYDTSLVDWTKFRLTYKGGRDFIDEYLKQFTTYEESDDFERRKAISYCPAFAKSALNEIKNAIFQRTADIKREGVPSLFETDVDHKRNSMGNFVAKKILPELLSIGKVGVYVDMPVSVSQTLVGSDQPYMYTYGAEDIRSWLYENDVLTRVLLRDYSYKLDAITGLPEEQITSFRYLTLTESGVIVQFYDEKGNETDSTLLNLPAIPFTIFEIANSLLTDVADYQVALLNLESSDITFAHSSNFALYTEQFDPRYEAGYQKQDGKEESTDEAGSKEIKIGVAQGRRYPMNADRPGYINPSPEPLLASMKKGEELKKDIRSLVSLALTNLTSSDKSKAMDVKALENGLNYIGFVLEDGETILTEFWNNYLGIDTQIKISYPRDYVLKSDAERLIEAEGKESLIDKVPSHTYRQEITKQIASTMLKGNVSESVLDKIYKEIDNTKVIVSDPTVVAQDWDNGFVSTKLASEIRGYPPEEVAAAKADHAERLRIIKEAQTSEDEVGAARGIDDLQVDQLSSTDEKDGKTQRGDAK